MVEQEMEEEEVVQQVEDEGVMEGRRWRKRRWGGG